MAAPKKSKVVELFWKVHPWLYKASGGRVGGRLVGMPVLLLTTRGRKSGLPRERALTYVASGAAFVVIASYLGEPHHPDWYLNLKAHPDASVRVGRNDVPVRAREAAGDERARLWAEVTRVNPDYNEYQSRTKRTIPVLVLEPRA
jgi:deazaflavin-dependent oxidoreductase (nitroreductase family)